MPLCVYWLSGIEFYLEQTVKITKTNGFSLLELMIVLTIFGIMASTASFYIVRYTNNTNLRTAARQLLSDIANAKQRSVTEGLCYRMTITTGTPGNYTIERADCSCCSACSSPCTSTPTFTVRATKSPTDIGAGLRISNTTYNGSIIYFQPRGTSSFGAITLVNSKVCKGSNCSTATITSNITGKTYVTFAMQ
jgi:prepilin-type N-terminal cleavage/methylation domain-containing protein